MLALIPGPLQTRASQIRGLVGLLFHYSTTGTFLLWVLSGDRGPLGRLRFYHQLVPSLLTGASLLCGPAPFPFLSKESIEQVASESYLAESYLVLTVSSLGGNSLRMGCFPFPAPHSLQEMSLSLGEPLSSVGKLQGGWDGENKQWLSGFSRQEASLLPSLIWPGRSGLGAGATLPTLHCH